VLEILSNLKHATAHFFTKIHDVDSFQPMVWVWGGTISLSENTEINTLILMRIQTHMR